MYEQEDLLASRWDPLFRKHYLIQVISVNVYKVSCNEGNFLLYRHSGI